MTSPLVSCFAVAAGYQVPRAQGLFLVKFCSSL